MVHVLRLPPQCGVEWRRNPTDRRRLLLTFLRLERITAGRFERFTQHGPLAMLPMSNGRCSRWCGAILRNGAMRLRLVRRPFLYRTPVGLWLAAWENYPRRKTRCLSAGADHRIAVHLPSRRAGRQCGADAAPNRRARLQPWPT